MRYLRPRTVECTLRLIAQRNPAIQVSRHGRLHTKVSGCSLLSPQVKWPGSHHVVEVWPAQPLAAATEPAMAQTPDDDEFGLDSADEAELLAAQENAKSQADRESSVSSLFAQMQSIFTRPADVDHDQEARDALRQLTRQLLQRLETPLPPVSQAKRKTDTEQSEIEYPVLPKRQRKEEDALLSTSQSLTVATQVLRTRFGMQAFRLKQAQAITRLLEGGSCVVVFPTGGGKSLCYQAPALAFAEMDKLESIRQGLAETGITLVVSPLIALMKDQVDALKRRGISAAVLDSTKTKEEYMATVEAMRNGTLDILYCAPERLNNEGFVASIARVRGGVRLLAVDEAHCISEWGHAFRPDYLKVARFSREIEAERVVCLTATATPKVSIHWNTTLVKRHALTLYPSLRRLLRMSARHSKSRRRRGCSGRRPTGPISVYKHAHSIPNRSRIRI